MKTLVSLALLLLLPSRPARAGDKTLLYEAASTGKPAVDREIAQTSAEVLRRRIESHRMRAKVEVRPDGRIAVVPSFWGSLSEEDLRPLLKPSKLEIRKVVEEDRKPRAGEEILYEFSLEGKTRQVRKQPFLVEKNPSLTGDRVKSAQVSVDPYGGTVISVELDENGTQAFGDLTRESVGRRLAIVVDGNVVSAPVVREEIRGGRIQISGSFSMEEAQDLARGLNSGPLPPGLRRVDAGAPAQEPAVAAAASSPAAQQAPAAGKPATAPPKAQLPAPRTAPSAPSAPPPPKSEVDDLPRSLGRARPDAFAIVIGVERYRQSLARADFAVRDAQAVADYLTKVLGWKEENVVLLTDEHAAKSDLEKYIEDWLSSRVRDTSTVMVFYSGHGAPDPAKGDSFLVPYDGDPSFLKRTGYPLKKLYAVLGRLPAKTVFVALDACFSGSGGRSVLAKGARPLVAVPAKPAPTAKVSVMTAAAGDQIGSSDPDRGHGIFTFHFLKAIRDAAAAGKAPSWGEVFETLRPRVEADARRISHSEQTPELAGPPEMGQGSL